MNRRISESMNQSRREEMNKYFNYYNSKYDVWVKKKKKLVALDLKD